jgi:hypothetical protein
MYSASELVASAYDVAIDNKFTFQNGMSDVIEKIAAQLLIGHAFEFPHDLPDNIVRFCRRGSMRHI